MTSMNSVKKVISEGYQSSCCYHERVGGWSNSQQVLQVCRTDRNFELSFLHFIDQLRLDLRELYLLTCLLFTMTSTVIVFEVAFQFVF